MSTTVDTVTERVGTRSYFQLKLQVWKCCSFTNFRRTKAQLSHLMANVMYTLTWYEAWLIFSFDLFCATLPQIRIPTAHRGINIIWGNLHLSVDSISMAIRIFLQLNNRNDISTNYCIGKYAYHFHLSSIICFRLQRNRDL